MLKTKIGQNEDIAPSPKSPSLYKGEAIHVTRRGGP
jgi:hypothetical protein